MKLGGKLGTQTNFRCGNWFVSLIFLAGCKSAAPTLPAYPNLGAAEELSVEAIFGGKSLAGTLPRAARWSPDGRTVTYLKGGAKEEVLDLWAYDLEAGKSSVLVASTDLVPEEEQSLSKEEEARRERARVFAKGIVDYQWSPKGGYLLFPLSGDLFLFDLATRKTRRLTKTEEAEIDPKFSPDEKRISFVRKHEIFALELEGGKEFQLTSGATEKVWNGEAEFVAQEEMDRMTGTWWAPGSDRIAYIQVDHRDVPPFHIPDYSESRVAWETQLYPKAGDPNVLVKLGVVDIEGGKTTWIDLGKETDIYLPRVEWLPDGKTLSFQLQSRRQETLDLYLCDPASGSTRRVHREVEKEWVDLHSNLRFLADGKRFLWSSEESGWNHLYLGFGAVDEATDGPMQPLTSGSWDVTGLAGVDEKAGTVYFAGTEKSHLERHLYRVRLDGKGLERITQEEGWHAVTLSPDFQHYIDQYSNPARPPSFSVHRIDGMRIGSIEEEAPTRLLHYRLSAPEFLSFYSEEGQSFFGKMIKPPGFDPGRRHPVLVFVYGGPGSQTVTKAWGGNRELWHQMLAQKGYIVFTMDGRGTGGRGKAWTRAVYKDLGHWETVDQAAGAKYLQSLPYIDPDRIGIWGWSYGGYMACMAMLASPGPFRVGVAVAPVTAWRNYDTHYTERYMGLPQENPSGYEASAPLTHAKNLRGKLLLVHGMADDNVHFQDTVQLADALVKAKKPFDLMVYPGRRHGISGRDAQVHVYEKITDFLLKNL